MKKLTSTKELETLRTKIVEARDPKKTVITVCGGTGCHGYGCQKVIEAFRQERTKRKLEKTFELRVSGCHGFCERGPLALITPKGIFYQRIDPADVPEIIEKTILGDEVVEKLIYDGGAEAKSALEQDVPFYAKQERLVFGANQRINADSIEDYIADGGYAAIEKALAMKPEAVIEEVKQAGLPSRARSASSSATPTRATRAPTWTARCSRATRTA